MELRLSDIQRFAVNTEHGKRLGHLFDVRSTQNGPGEPPRIEALLVGRGGLARRLGIGRGRVTEVPIEMVIRWERGSVVVDWDGQ